MQISSPEGQSLRGSRPEDSESSWVRWDWSRHSPYFICRSKWGWLTLTISTANQKVPGMSKTSSSFQKAWQGESSSLSYPWWMSGLHFNQLLLPNIHFSTFSGAKMGGGWEKRGTDYVTVQEGYKRTLIIPMETFPSASQTADINECASYFIESLLVSAAPYASAGKTQAVASQCMKVHR